MAPVDLTSAALAGTGTPGGPQAHKIHGQKMLVRQKHR